MQKKIERNRTMTLNEFINQLETFMPNKNAELVVRIAGSDDLGKIWVMGGDKEVVFLVAPIRKEQA